MHSYGREDSIIRNQLIAILIISIPLAWLFSLGLKEIFPNLPWWIETPSVLGIFGIISSLFDNFFWKSKIIQKFKFLYIPNISGEWSVELKSSYNPSIIVNSVAKINQTNSKICISMENESSSSYSIYSAINKIEHLSEFELIYYYVNEPKPLVDKKLVSHKGFVVMRIGNNCDIMNGEYFNGRGRTNVGELKLVRRKN